MNQTITDAVLGPLLRTDPAGPRITHYDDGAGSRVELSGATLANWAAKTANWLRDELDVQPGDTVAVLLPPHWQTAGVLLGAWWCGATVTLSAAGAQVALCGVSAIAEASGADEVAAVGLDALGMGVRALPPGVRDYATEVRVHGDTFTAGASGPGAEQVLGAARARAAMLGLTTGDRVLSTQGWDGGAPGEVLLAVLAADASLVQCTGTDPATLERRRAAERVTVTLS
ncbi:MAG TPA: TIGR03089 family protein [Pseudonocardiaceae bacterium]